MLASHSFGYTFHSFQDVQYNNLISVIAEDIGHQGARAFKGPAVLPRVVCMQLFVLQGCLRYAQRTIVVICDLGQAKTHHSGHGALPSGFGHTRIVGTTRSAEECKLTRTRFLLYTRVAC